MDAGLAIFGIRHHGPGSARSLCQALEAWSPDCLLIEGPPDAVEVLGLAAHAEMRPPVALLIYDPEQPQRSVFYPFAAFSPEWQAIQFALARNLAVRFMDLPQSIRMGIAYASEVRTANPEFAPSPPEVPPEPASADGPPTGECGSPPAPGAASPALPADPLTCLARAAGYTDPERWWEHLVEHRHGPDDVFGAVLEAMTALREAVGPASFGRLDPQDEARREAHMRQTLRAARKEGFARIAVVCGAWHAPALAQMPPASHDAALLKGLPKRKVVATWIPWTYGRLALASGYGAGIESPGWYDFLWSLRGSGNGTVAPRWLTRVAQLLRDEDLDASSASVIEAVRLAESLAALRGCPLPGLPELNEATQTVLCFGDPLPLRVIADKLIVSERLGQVPRDTPAVPLADDLAREQKRLRFPPEAIQKSVDLDLRNANDLDRSRLLHRLNLLGVAWGRRERERGSAKGTFHERWSVQWQPEFAVTLIEAGVWGNTVPVAAGAKVRRDADGAPDLPTLTALLDATVLADLPEAAQHLMDRLQAVAAVASDVGHLMGAVPPLANILRYGSVRQTDATLVGRLVDGLVARICVGLPGACGSLNDEAAEAMFGRLIETQAAIGLLQNAEHTAAWNAVLRQLADSPGLHGLIGGRACRLLHESQQLEPAEAARRLGLALSRANAPAAAAAWVDGFLRNSGLLLLHDAALWRVLDEWVAGLAPDHFTGALPLLRRTFSTFQPAERRQLGTRVTVGIRAPTVPPVAAEEFDEERACAALPLLARLLGLEGKEEQ